MAYELREGQGSLFKNDKGDNPKRPDYRGSIMLDGVVYALSAWIKDKRDGGKYLSIQRGDPQVADHQRERPADIKPPMGNAPAAPRRSMKDMMDDEVPFAPEWR